MSPAASVASTTNDPRRIAANGGAAKEAASIGRSPSGTPPLAAAMCVAGSSWPALDAPRLTGRVRGRRSSGMRAYWRPRTRCCCSGCRCCFCCGWPSGASPLCRSRSPRAAPGGRGRARLPSTAGRLGEPAVWENRTAQAPRIGMLGMSDPRHHMLIHGLAIDSPGAHVLLRQTSAAPR
jgi:hypothetical protein